MSRRARTFLGLAAALAALAAAAAPQALAAGEPVIVPPAERTASAGNFNDPCGPGADIQPGQPGAWTTCLLPETGDIYVPWPAPGEAIWGGPKNFVMPKPGLYATWLGEARTDAGYPLIWRDVGSGFPTAPASGPYYFPLAGKYFWECDSADRCIGTSFFRLKGTMYVIGPRALVTTKLISADNSGSSITYGFDASASFVTDYDPHTIVEYSYDFEDDGTYDQTSPEPTAQHTFAPGPHMVRIRVKDETGRYGEYPFWFEIPYVRPGNPVDVPLPDTASSAAPTTGVKFSTAKIKVKAVRSIKVKVLRKRGLQIKISGLTRGDRITARLLKGKKTLVAVGRGSAATSTKTVRLRVGRTGARTLKKKPRKKRLVLDVAVEGTDGYQVTKRSAVRVS